MQLLSCSNKLYERNAKINCSQRRPPRSIATMIHAARNLPLQRVQFRGLFSFKDMLTTTLGVMVSAVASGRWGPANEKRPFIDLHSMRSSGSSLYFSCHRICTWFVFVICRLWVFYLSRSMSIGSLRIIVFDVNTRAQALFIHSKKL